MYALYLDLTDTFNYYPRNNTIYDVDGYRTAWGNCDPPAAQPPITPIWINGSSGEEINLKDPRVEISKVSRATSVISLLRIKNATKYETGRWACKAIHKYGTRTVYFNVVLNGN